MYFQQVQAPHHKSKNLFFVEMKFVAMEFPISVRVTFRCLCSMFTAMADALLIKRVLAV